MENTKKRILIFSTAYFPFIGGAEVAVKEITDRIDDIDFDMITARLDRKVKKVERVGNVTVHRVGVGVPIVDKVLLAFFGYLKGMQLMKKKGGYDVIWSIMASYGGLAGVRLKQKTEVPFLLTLQEGDPIPEIMKKAKLVSNEFRKIFTKADGVQAISTYLLNWGHHMSIDTRTKGVIPNGVDITRFQPAKDAQSVRTKIRNRMGIPHDAHVIVTVSRLVKKNGVADMIEAMHYMDGSVHLLVVGGGELEDELREKAAHSTAKDRIHFAGIVEHSLVPTYLWASDVFCRPSLSEGLGNVFLEAIAAGLPIVGTHVGGITDFLVDGETGFVCEPEDSKSIADALQKCTTLSDAEKQQMHMNGMKLVRNKYNWDHIASKMRVMFDDVCVS